VLLSISSLLTDPNPDDPLVSRPCASRRAPAALPPAPARPRHPPARGRRAPRRPGSARAPHRAAQRGTAAPPGRLLPIAFASADGWRLQQRMCLLHGSPGPLSKPRSPGAPAWAGCAALSAPSPSAAPGSTWLARCWHPGRCPAGDLSSSSSAAQWRDQALTVPDRLDRESAPPAPPLPAGSRDRADLQDGQGPLRGAGEGVDAQVCDGLSARGGGVGRGGRGGAGQGEGGRRRAEEGGAPLHSPRLPSLPAHRRPPCLTGSAPGGPRELAVPGGGPVEREDWGISLCVL
jgi:hypothetical protein